MARSFAGGSAQHLLSTSFASGTFPLTVACQFRTSVVMSSAFQRVFTWQNSGADVIATALINYPSAGDVANQVYKGGTNALPHKSGVLANTWHHVASISKSASNTIYLDGVQGSTATYTDPGFTGMTYLWVGATAGPTQYLSGQVAELGVWSVELTSAEIGALSDGYTPLEIRPDALIAYYPFGGKYGQYDRDYWKSKYDLTPTNSPTWAEHSQRIIYPRRRFWQFSPVAPLNNYVFTVDHASATLTGQSAGLNAGRVLTVSHATSTLAGQAATLKVDRALTVGHASAAITGQSVGVAVGRVLTVGNASATGTGQAATLRVDRVLTVGNAAATLTGQAVAMSKGQTLTVEHGSATLSGQAVTLKKAWKLTVEAATATLAGQLATLSYSGDTSDAVDLTPDAETVAHAQSRTITARARRREVVANARGRATVARAR